MTITVMITDTYKVEIDSMNNHQPFYFKEGGEVITVGKYKGSLSKDRWQTTNKHFKNLARAIHYGVEQEYLNQEEVLTLQDHIDNLNKIYTKTDNLLGKVK